MNLRSSFRPLAACALLAACGPLVPRDPADDPSPASGQTEEVSSNLVNAPPQPVAWFSFDEKCTGTTVYDTQPLPAVSSGSKVNGVGCIEGKVGRAASFDGVNDYVDIPDRTAFHFANVFSISAWIKPSTTSGAIAGKWQSPNAFLLSLSGGKALFQVALASGTTVAVPSSSTIATGTWTHLAGVYDGTKVRLYVNGTLSASASASGNIASSTAHLRVGALPSGASLFTGGIDELRLYGAALSAANVSRLVNGIQHRRLRAVAFDPKFTSDPNWLGKRLHDFYASAGWRTPSAVVQYWIDFLNRAAGERIYLPEDGSYGSAVKYVEEIPWNNNGMDCPLSWGGTASLIVQTAEQARDNGPPPGKALDIFSAFKEDNAALSFDLNADANSQKFHELIIITPPDWGYGKEGTMVANTNDTSAFFTHDGLMRFPALKSDKKYIFHGVSFTRDDRNLEQFWHRCERLLGTAWSSVYGNGNSCGSDGWWIDAARMSDLRSAYDLFSMQDRMVNGEGHVGGAHWPVNTSVEYVRNHKDRVPSNYQFWSTYPASFPFDLTKNARRVPVSCEDWGGPGCVDPAGVDELAMIWQLSKMPRASGTFDGRANDWWLYISNPNYQAGRGQPTTAPVKGPFHGGMDLRLTLYPDHVGLTWVTAADGSGSYQVQRSTNRSTWTALATLGGTTGSFDTSRPANGVDTFYRVAWTSGTTTRFSDQLGVNLGTATPVNVDASQRPPVNPSISLYQLSNPYVRWELPTSCGLPTTVAHAPCVVDTCGGLCMTCNADHECRDNGGTGNFGSDYHMGMTKYDLEKRGTSFTTVWTLNRRPGWEGQYNHLRFSAADNAVPAGTVVGYRVVAYPLDSNNTPGPAWGHTDLLLAVPGQATVGL